MQVEWLAWETVGGLAHAPTAEVGWFPVADLIVFLQRESVFDC